MMNEFLIIFIKIVNLLCYYINLFICALALLPLDGGYLLYLLSVIGCTCGFGFIQLILSCIDKFLNE